MGLIYESVYKTDGAWALGAARMLVEPINDERGCGAEILHQDDTDLQPWLCTRDRGHVGWHVACLSDATIVAVWTSDF